MWPEIFIHDSNGDKVAIILLRAKGNFHDRNDFDKWKALFAINTMLSSVQCFNVRKAIEEFDLKYLHYLYELAEKQKIYQNFHFIVHDWANPSKHKYGLCQQKSLLELISDIGTRPFGIKKFKKSIDSSFEEFDAFLLPRSTTDVMTTSNGDSKSFRKDYLKYVKELELSILMPEKLVIKKVNGQKMATNLFIPYMQDILKLFHENSTELQLKTISKVSYSKAKEADFGKRLKIAFNLNIDAKLNLIMHFE